MLRLHRDDYLDIVGHAFDDVPNEACGLFAGAPGSDLVQAVYRCGNAADSARVYTLDPLDHLRADRDAEGRGLQIIGVYHSHTHTEAYPSPTDVEQAPDPTWRYVIVSLKDPEPVLRSFTIAKGAINEEPVVVEGR